ncbi:MAG TPA: LLM class flavin-dependent oxidoreductase, partial [Rugosimonospora sp.]|nr:LLM class flavin-dependent oxidoreductase [Rugosimonospora sp.]
LPADTPADRLLAWQAAGITGYRLRGDLATVTRGLVPELQARGAFRRGYPPGTSLRGLLGLPRPASRYARGSA